MQLSGWKDYVMKRWKRGAGGGGRKKKVEKKRERKQKRRAINMKKS